MNNKNQIELSILVAAYQEEENLPIFLKSLETQTFFKNKENKKKVEVIIIDDGSTDKSYEILKNSNTRLENFKFLKNKINIGKKKSLIKLSQIAAGRYFLFTDADVKLSPFWVEKMYSQISHFQSVAGISFPQADSLWEGWQQVEYLLMFFYTHLFNKININLSVMGNNWLLSRRVYEQVGGYQHLAATPTEDFSLFKKINSFFRKKNNKFRHSQLFEPETALQTYALKSYQGLFQQRLRWAKGVWQDSSIWERLGLSIYGMQFFIYVFIFLIDIKLFVIFLTLSFVIEFLFLVKVSFLLKKSKILFFYVLGFICYQKVLYAAVFLGILLRVSVRWKGREF